MLTVILVSYLVILLDTSIVITGLPEIRQSLGFSVTGLSWVQNIWLFAIYGWNTLIFNQSRQLRRSRSRLECEVRTQPFQTHSWLELLSLKGLSDVLRFPLYGRVLHTAFWPE